MPAQVQPPVLHPGEPYGQLPEHCDADTQRGDGGGGRLQGGPKTGSRRGAGRLCVKQSWEPGKVTSFLYFALRYGTRYYIEGPAVPRSGGGEPFALQLAVFPGPH